MQSTVLSETAETKRNNKLVPNLHIYCFTMIYFSHILRFEKIEIFDKSRNSNNSLSIYKPLILFLPL